MKIAMIMMNTILFLIRLSDNIIRKIYNFGDVAKIGATDTVLPLFYVAEYHVRDMR